MKISFFHYIIISLILSIFLILNIFFFNLLFLGLIFGFLYLFFYGFFLGNTIFPQEEKPWKLFYGSFSLIAFISFSGALLYYFYQLNNLAIILILLFIPLALGCFFKEISFIFPKIKCRITILETIYLLLVFLSFYLLFTHQSAEALTSPWQVLPYQFLIIYFFSSLTLLTILIYQKTNILFVIIHAFLTSSLALIIYKLGYGYDPFIHQAAEKVISEKGFISPKPLYYIGQYSLVVFLSKFLNLKIIWIDKLLTPLLSSFYLLPLIYHSLYRSFRWEKKYSLALSLLFFLLPLSFFISTTPQSLAILFNLIIIFLGLFYLKTKKISLIYLFFLGATTFFIHPLSGLPSLIFLSLLAFKKSILRKIIIFFSFISLPLSFFFSSLLSAQLTFKKISFSFKPFLSYHYQFIYDLIYFYGFNFFFWFFLIILAGIIIAFLKKEIKSLSIYLFAFFILLINYLLIKFFITFRSLIEYEQEIYSQRVFHTSLYFLLPFFFIALYFLIKKARSPFYQIFFLFFFSGLLTFSLYLSYPVNDPYHPSKGYSVSSSGIKAVREIQKNTEKDFIVIADQMISAGALKEFGFYKHYRGYFYYPIPTGGDLYKYYLKMIYEKPDKKTMLQAMDLTGVKESYFVLPDYWKNYRKIAEKAKLEADSFQEIDQGKVYIFKYTK